MIGSYGIRVSRLLASAMMLLAVTVGIPVAFAADEIEWILGGGFEQGSGDFEVYRYPRFLQGSSTPVVSLVEGKALGGHYALRLPGVNKGGYRFVFPEYPLPGNSAYKLAFRIRSAAAIRIQVEFFFGRAKLSAQYATIEPGGQGGEFLLHTHGDSEVSREGNDKTYRIVLRIIPAADAVIDEISLVGPGRASKAAGPWVRLTPQVPLGIYGIGEAGTMRVASAVDSKLSYRILETLRGAVVAGAEIRSVGQNGIIRLFTDQRGSYLVEVYAGTAGGKPDVLARRRYAVIDRGHAKPALTRYGIAMEEHGLRTHIDASIQAADFYRLAAELGAGSVRIFTLAMPDILSTDGVRYDFSQLDAALALCREYDLEPLVELGSNAPHRLPEWLRTSVSRPDTIDLGRGLATKKLKGKLAHSGGKQYLDLAAYERYLRRVFEHFGDRVRYFEIWNEPGHKFLPEDFLKIARLTRKVQQDLAPQAKLVGYTSTKSPGRHKRQPDSGRYPGFLDAMLAADHGDSIDVLSYHSAHAFKFLEAGQDNLEDETGYVELLHGAVDKYGVSNAMPIWDSERGIPWSSDRVAGDDVNTSSLEVARRLPAIYAASLASGVERLFWFNMDSSTSTIAKTNTRYGFFDANLQPMPHLVVYDAMTELIAAARFTRKIEQEDGLKIYFFESPDAATLMAFNWRKRECSFNLVPPVPGYRLLDAMGNEVMSGAGAGLQTSEAITVDGWAHYLVFPGLRSDQIRIANQGC